MYLGPVPEFLLFNSATRRFSTAVGFEGKISLFVDALREGLSKAAFTRTRFHIDTVSGFRNRIEIDAVWKCLHGTVFARKSKS